MARTANPNKQLDNFIAEANESVDRYRRVEAALEIAGEPDLLRKGVAEDAAFRLGVLWETFQGAWHLAAISRDPSTFRGHVQGELNKSLPNEARRLIEAFDPTALTIPTSPKMPQIIKALDPQGFNVTFVDAKAWNASAQKHLGATHAALVNAVASDNEASSLIHLLKKLRNHLAHASEGSKEEFNRAVRARVAPARVGLVGAANEPLQRDARGVDDVGKYLRVRPTLGGPRRIEILHERVKTVAEMLRTWAEGDQRLSQLYVKAGIRHDASLLNRRCGPRGMLRSGPRGAGAS